MKSLSGSGRVEPGTGVGGSSPGREASYRPIGAKLDFFHPGWEEKSLGAGAQPSPGEMVCRAEQAHSGQTHESPGRGRFPSRACVIETAFAVY